MSQTLLIELKRENLSTHFVLPLLKINKFSFLASNFADCYLSEDRKFLMVHIMTIQLVSRQLFIHPDYRGLRKGNDCLYMLFQIPPKWRADVNLFCEGKFSLMSKASKAMIYRYSGLSLKVKNKDTGKIVTDGRLLALEKHDVLKRMWDSIIEPVDEITTELLSVPGERAYKDLSELILIQKSQLL